LKEITSRRKRERRNKGAERKEIETCEGRKDVK
jgi:hypothetical protein